MKVDIDEVRDEIAKYDGNTKVYIGCDSERVKIKGKWHADYMIAVVVHMDGCHGCKLFGEFSREMDYDKDYAPRTRLMNECYKVVEMYQKLEEVLMENYCEVHLDLNPKEEWASNKVIKQAMGYVRGVTGIQPKVKPQAFAASYAADRLKHAIGFRNSYVQ